MLWAPSSAVRSPVPVTSPELAAQKMLIGARNKIHYSITPLLIMFTWITRCDLVRYLYVNVHFHVSIGGGKWIEG